MAVEETRTYLYSVHGYTPHTWMNNTTKHTQTTMRPFFANVIAKDFDSCVAYLKGRWPGIRIDRIALSNGAAYIADRPDVEELLEKIST